MKGTLRLFIEHHEKQKADNLRLGQRFCNRYIKESWPELYYADDQKAVSLIAEWLERHQYTTRLPPRIHRINLPH